MNWTPSSCRPRTLGSPNQYTYFRDSAGSRPCSASETRPGQRLPRNRWGSLRRRRKSAYATDHELDALITQAANPWVPQQIRTLEIQLGQGRVQLQRLGQGSGSLGANGVS